MCIDCRLLVLCCVGGLILTGSQATSAEPPPFDVKFDKPGDSASIQIDPERTRVVITTETGIGRMTCISKDGHWPRDITLRLRYAHAKPFGTLEGFEMTSSRIQIRSNSRQSGKVPFFLADDDGKFSRDDLNPSGWLKLEFKPHGDGLDVILPSHLWREEKEVKIQWIDYYR